MVGTSRCDVCAPRPAGRNEWCQRLNHAHCAAERGADGAAETVSKVFIGWRRRQRGNRLAGLDSARRPRPIASATTARVDFGLRQLALTLESLFSDSGLPTDFLFPACALLASAGRVFAGSRSHTPSSIGS